MNELDSTVEELVTRIRAKTGNSLVDLLKAETSAELFDWLVPRLGAAASHLEKNKAHLDGLDENGLTAFVAAYLAIPDLVSVEQEAHSNGHVDLTITVFGSYPLRALGEAKIYSGPSNHIKAVHQLIDRYVTGREFAGAIVSYVRKAAISTLAQKVEHALNREKPCGQLRNATALNPVKWACATVHRLETGDELRVCHIHCNLY